MTRIVDQLDDYALRCVDAVLVENSWMLDYASRINTTTNSVRYAPPGIDTSIFRPLPQRLQYKSIPPYVLSVGRFDDPRKNVEMLIDAYALLKEKVAYPLRLQLAGSGDPGVAFWKKVRRLGLESYVSFHLQPSKEELIAYYQKAACFALSSDEEGFGVVIAEAMACGIPVVATRCGGPEGIITDGWDGFLVKVGDIAAMADRLQRLVQDVDVNRTMGERAGQTAIARFSEEVAARAFLETYRELLARSAPTTLVGSA